VDSGAADPRAVRRALALALIARRDAGDDSLVAVLLRVCQAAADHLGVAGVAVNLMSPAGLESVAAATDLRTKELVELQFTTGEGPCCDAFALRRPVLVPDLASLGQPWPGYAAAALDRGARGAFAFPLNVGAAGLGVLDVFADVPGSLSEEQVAMALTFARIATEILLDGRLVSEEGRLDDGLQRALDNRAEVYQAQGMLMVSLDVGLAEAMVRMRAHAFSTDRALIDVARDIVAGRRFEVGDL
jgi:GAF domain-containing protein